MRRIPQSARLLVRTTSTDPFFNLALEEWLFRNGPVHQTCLYLWRNRECVVIGRNQNPWVECNVPWLQRLGIPLVRRHSGGGAVFHDLGNSLYTVMMPRDVFSRTRYAQMVVDALGGRIRGLKVSPRHDIFVEERWKVSGSAYRLVRGRAYHHGTMLLDCNLQRLTMALQSPVTTEMHGVGSAISSVVSPVKNLSDVAQGADALDHDHFCRLLAQEFAQLEGDLPLDEIVVSEAELARNEEICSIAMSMKSIAWTFDKTPPFAIKLSIGTIKVEDGIIVESDDKRLIGRRFDVDTFSSLLQPSRPRLHASQ